MRHFLPETMNPGIIAVHHIDQTFPFTEQELVQAFALTQPEEQAQEMASHVAGVVREVVEGAAAVREARAQGSGDAEEVEEPQWIVPDEALAQLSFASDELAARRGVQPGALGRDPAGLGGRPPGGRRPAGAHARHQAEADAVIGAIRDDWERAREKVREHVERGSRAAV